MSFFGKNGGIQDGFNGTGESSCFCDNFFGNGTIMTVVITFYLKDIFHFPNEWQKVSVESGKQFIKHVTSSSDSDALIGGGIQRGDNFIGFSLIFQCVFQAFSGFVVDYKSHDHECWTGNEPTKHCSTKGHTASTSGQRTAAEKRERGIH